MDAIKNIVSQVMGRLSSGDGVSCQEIQAAWSRLAGKSGSRVTAFKDGCVTVSADSSMRLVKLNLNRENLLKELQKDFPSVIKINFRVGA